MSAHSFTIGQSFEFVPGRFGGSAPGGTYTVLQLLPNDSADREYRVRCARDGHERVVRESQMRRRDFTGAFR